MKLRVWILAAAMAVFSVAAFAADVNGKWTAQVPGRGGEPRPVTFTFNAEGENLTGTMSGRQGAEIKISDGKIKGDEISFVVNMEFGGNAVKLLYNGKVSGDEIKFKSQREGGDRTTEFTAKKGS